MTNNFSHKKLNSNEAVTDSVGYLYRKFYTKPVSQFWEGSYKPELKEREKNKRIAYKKG